MLDRFIVTYNHQDRIVVLVEIRTDSFSYETSEVREFVSDIRLHIAAKSPADVEELLAQPFVTDESVTVGEKLAELRAYLKAPLEIARFVRWDTELPERRVGDDGPNPAPPYAAQLKEVS